MLSDRTDNEVIWAMQTWLSCTTLDPFEREILEQLRNALVLGGREAFLETGASYAAIFAAPLYSAADKARAQGIGAWPNAEQSHV